MKQEWSLKAASQSSRREGGESWEFCGKVHLSGHWACQRGNVIVGREKLPPRVQIEKEEVGGGGDFLSLQNGCSPPPPPLLLRTPTQSIHILLYLYMEYKHMSSTYHYLYTILLWSSYVWFSSLFQLFVNKSFDILLTVVCLGKKQHLACFLGLKQI